MVRSLISNIIFCLILLLTMAGGYSQNSSKPKNHIVVRRNANINHMTIINFWIEHKMEFDLQGDLEEVVLVMGNTGSGKTTLISALTGKKLQAIKRTGYVVIMDEENRIGTGVLSKTLIPEVITDNKRNITYIDCPGFRDNRNFEYEMSSIYFQNNLMNHVKKIKLILVINYESLKVNGNKNDFDDLFEHIGKFIKDISKFHDGIALVATKVENTYEASDDGTFFLSNDNQSVSEAIAEYLEMKKETYRNNTGNHEKHQMFVNLIDNLLQKKNNSYSRIAIFRQPTRQGLLDSLKATNNEIETITNMILKNLQYVEKNMDDFDFALSQSAKSTIDQIVNYIFRTSLTDRLHKIGSITITHYLQMEKQYTDIKILQERLEHACDVMSELENVDEPLELFQKLFNITNTLNVSVSLTNLNAVSNDNKILQFFTTVSNSNKETNMMLLKNEIHNVVESIQILKNFYDFLNNLQADLSMYQSQKLKKDRRIANIIASCAFFTNKAVQNIPDLENIVKEIGSDERYRKIKTLILNQFQTKHLKAVFNEFSSDFESSCISSSGQMIVKGYNIKMSDVVKIDCWAQAKIIQIFALNKIFIDCTIDKTGAEVQLFIFALMWEIVGSVKIILDGTAGKSHESAYAKSASFNTENGPNGLPGLPGGSAGHFYGIGKQFINSKLLEIHANGGPGGPGQHGGNGANGITGGELSESFFMNDRMSPDKIKDYLKQKNFAYSLNELCHHYEILALQYSVRSKDLYAADVIGKPAIKPSNGGDGGVGGRGGYPSKIVINGLGKLVNVKTSNNTGFIGLAGQGGHGGKRTSDGRRVLFEFIFDSVDNGFERVYYQNIEWFDGAEIPAGKDGHPGTNRGTEIFPKMTPLSNPSFAINLFKDFVRMNLFENTKESELRTLINEIENNHQIKAEYNTFAFVKEFEGLESQYIELKDKIEFLSFYDSLLRRVEEFSMSEKFLENKKVLNYIYTAALTKKFALKNKKHGKTVVNLFKYLSTIEINVKQIREAEHLQIVQNYQNEYGNTLRTKIHEANNFIKNKIEPEINKLWDESDNQIKAIIDEIKANKDSTKDAITSLENNKEKINKMMTLRLMLLPLKLAASGLCFIGPVGAIVGVAMTTLAVIAEGMLLDTTSSLGQDKIYSLNPNLKLMSRVTEVFNNKPKQLTNKLVEAVAKLEQYKEELSTTQKSKIEISQKIGDLKTRVNEVANRKVHSIADVDRRQKDAEEIEKQITEFTNSRKDILEKEKEQLNVMQTERKDVEKLRKEKKIEKSLRRINHVQSILTSTEIVFSFAKQLENDRAKIENIDDQISKYVDQIKDLEMLEDQVYNIIMPDLRQIEKVVNAVKASVNGSSHAKLDFAKWTVRTTLRDVKSLLQKFTYKMSYELQSNLKRYMDKIDEGFSILIDIYDRIDSYADSVKQAEYIAHIVSAPMINIKVTNSELRNAITDLKLIIQSNILYEKYGIALHAFKQHYYPFAAHVLQKFQLPNTMRLNDTETLRSNIIEKIENMKNHINENEAILDKYTKFIHEKRIFNSNTSDSLPFYVWEHDTIKDEIQRLFNGSEILIKADIFKGLNYNSVKYNDIGINFKLANGNLQNYFTSILRSFVLTMTMIGNNYYRCGERYYSISFDDDVTISYILKQDEEKNWIDPNKVYSTIRGSHTFLSPYGMWSIKLHSIDKSVSFDHLNVYANETIDLELIGRGYYIEQNSDFNFDICNEYLDTFYNIENIAKELV